MLLKGHLGCSSVLMLQIYFQKVLSIGLLVVMHNIKFLFIIQETVYKFPLLQENFVHVIVKTFSKFTTEVQVAHIDIPLLCFTQSCPDKIHYCTNILLSGISINHLSYVIKI